MSPEDLVSLLLAVLSFLSGVLFAYMVVHSGLCCLR